MKIKGNQGSVNSGGYSPKKPDSSGPVEEVTYQVYKKKVKISRKQVKSEADKAALSAFHLGQTNDPETFSKEMTDTIMSAYKDSSH